MEDHTAVYSKYFEEFVMDEDEDTDSEELDEKMNELVFSVLSQNSIHFPPWSDRTSSTSL